MLGVTRGAALYVGALIGVPIVFAGKRSFEILDPLRARQCSNPFLLNIGIVGIQVVRLVDHFLRALVHGNGIAHSR